MEYFKAIYIKINFYKKIPLYEWVRTICMTFKRVQCFELGLTKSHIGLVEALFCAWHLLYTLRPSSERHWNSLNVTYRLTKHRRNPILVLDLFYVTDISTRIAKTAHINRHWVRIHMSASGPSSTDILTFSLRLLWNVDNLLINIIIKEPAGFIGRNPVHLRRADLR